MPGSDTTTLIITGDSSGAVAALRSLGIAYQETGTQTEKGKKAQEGFNAMAIPGQRDIRQLSFAAFELSGSMGTLGPIAQQARSGINLLTSATQGTTGPIGIAIAAIGMMVYALTELFTATKKAEEASLKASEGLSKEGDNLKKYADLLKSEIEYRHQFISVRREDAEKQLAEVQNRTLLQNLMKGGLNVYGYEINALGKVVNAHWAETWAAAKYHEEIDKGLTKIAKYNVELETTTDKMGKLAVEQIKAAMGKTKTEMEKPGGPAPKRTPEEEAIWRQIMARQEAEKEGFKRSAEIERQAREDSIKFNEEYDKAQLDQEVLKFEALATLRGQDAESERMALEQKAFGLFKYTRDAVGAMTWLQKEEEKLNKKAAQDRRNKISQDMELIAGGSKTLIESFNYTEEQYEKAKMLEAAIDIAVYAYKAYAAFAAGNIPSGIAYTMAGAAAAIVAGGGGKRGGAVSPSGEQTIGGGYGGGGGTASPGVPAGPSTNYFYSSMVINGNVIGLDTFDQVMEDWWLRHIRAGGGDINRG